MPERPLTNDELDELGRAISEGEYPVSHARLQNLIAEVRNWRAQARQKQRDYRDWEYQDQLDREEDEK